MTPPPRKHPQKLDLLDLSDQKVGSHMGEFRRIQQKLHDEFSLKAIYLMGMRFVGLLNYAQYVVHTLCVLEIVDTQITFC